MAETQYNGRFKINFGPIVFFNPLTEERFMQDTAPKDSHFRFSTYIYVTYKNSAHTCSFTGGFEW